MFLLRAALAMSIAAACSDGQPAGLEADCKRSFDEAPRPDLTPDQRARFEGVRAALTRLCVADAWPHDVTDCLAKATAATGVVDCVTRLPDAQKERLFEVYAEETERHRR